MPIQNLEALIATRGLRIGNWMQTYSGRQYWPYDPRPEEVYIEDIAHHLSLLCRYTGAVDRFYSVAEHSIHVSNGVPAEYAFQGLMHDATEAYISDLGRPIKGRLHDYQALEALNWRAVTKRFGLPLDLHASVHDIDRRMCMNEKAALMKPCPAAWDADLGEPIPGIQIQAWEPFEAEWRFLQRFLELSP